MFRFHSEKFNPKTQIPDLSGKVAFVTGSAVSVVAILVPRFEELGSILAVSVVAILVPRFEELDSILAVSVVGLDYVRV
jgi:hypothetical protein